MQNTKQRQSHIAVVGAGFTGMVCAYRLLRAGYRVSILESHATMGGLSKPQSFGSFSWDRFYHCILTSDQALLSLIDDLGLDSELRWTLTDVGLFSHGKLYKMTSPADLLRYPHLPLTAKLRLGLMTMFVSRMRDGLRLETLPLCQWARRIFGKKVFDQFWEPLLRCKLGELRRYASAAFLWGTIVRLASTRQRGPGKREKLGYVRGGYRTVFERLQHAVFSLKGETNLGVEIRSIGANTKNMSEGAVCVSAKHKEMTFDGVVLTVPNKVVGRLLQTDSEEYKDRLRQVMYLGIICVVLVLKRRLSPFYVTNVTERIGFTGVIEMTNLIDAATETNGRHLVYLPHYTSPSDPLFASSDEAIWAHIWPDLERMYPDLKEEDIEGRFVFKELNVQPVPTIDYSRIVPPARTPVAGVYVANTSQIINNTLNNNAMTSIAEATCKALMQDIPLMQPIIGGDALSLEIQQGQVLHA